MKRINLKDFYPFYEEDCYVDVPDELAALMTASHGLEGSPAVYEKRHSGVMMPRQRQSTTFFCSTVL